MHIGLAMGTSLRCTLVELWVPGTSVGKCTLVEQRTPLELSGQGQRDLSLRRTLVELWAPWDPREQCTWFGKAPGNLSPQGTGVERPQGRH